ncbi:anthrone oxygenase family protein [Spirillospora sp. NPDC047279]|uniref:anthrone oxygenase family protein n=1 Tax=Spirillospora sp. NPDC047279 TaxID=3155478 RepID=UPI0033E73C69
MIVKNLSTVSLIAATLTTGMIAGLMADWAYTVLPGMSRSSDRTFVEGIQQLNRAIQNGWFFLTFLGAILFCGLAAYLAWRGHGRDALPWIVAGTALYLVTLVITFAANVPLNDQIDKAGDPARIKDLAAVRADFESTWMTWHIVRTLTNVAAFACLTWALVIHGGERAKADGGANPSRQPVAEVDQHPPRPQPHGPPPNQPP